MYKITKLKSLYSYRFFDSYQWDNHLLDFDKYNIIYGWNGSGKSTFCDFFHELEKENELLPEVKYELQIQENNEPSQIITKKSSIKISSYLKVFHQDYVDNLISKLDKVDLIYYIGENEGNAAADIELLRKKVQVYESELFSEIEKGIRISKDFDDYKRDKATYIRNITDYKKSYDYNKFYNRYKELGPLSPIILDDKTFDELKISISTNIKEAIPKIRKDLCTSKIKEFISGILNESPVYQAIKGLEEDESLKKWVEEGYTLHKNREIRICEFCHNPISDELWGSLESHFNDSLNKFKEKISLTLRTLNAYSESFTDIKNNLPHDTQFYDEYLTEYKELKKEAIKLCSNYFNFITKTIEIVEKKRDKITGQDYLDAFNKILVGVDFNYIIFDKINALIEKHNIKTKDFTRYIEQAKMKLECHVIAESIQKIKDFEGQIADNTAEQKKINGRLLSDRGKLNELERKVKDSRIPAETINNDIQFILGRNNLCFDWKENGYEIKRDGKTAFHLSKGERNAIALIYFFNVLLDNTKVSINDVIVILDDPISSFDSNYYYSAIAYIRQKLENVGQAFILTHKFSLYKDFSKMFSSCKTRYLLEREKNGPVIKEESSFLRNFHDEYCYLFKKIYEFVRNYKTIAYEDYIAYPNMGRRLLEGFLSFKVPEIENENTDMLSKALSLEKGKNPERIRAISRLFNNQSHLRKVSSYDDVDNILDNKQLPDILKNLLDFIKAHDEHHYNTIVRQIEKGCVSSKEEETETTLLRKIPIYDLRASAGLGNILDENSSSEQIETFNTLADFGLKVSGDSMEPRIKDKDTILVKKQNTIGNAEIGIIILNGEILCKKIIVTNEYPMLVSLNKKYLPINIKESDQFEIAGVVVEIVS